MSTLTDLISTRKADRQRDRAQNHARPRTDRTHHLAFFRKRFDAACVYLSPTEIPIYLRASDLVT